MQRQRPGSVIVSTRALMGLVALSGLTAVLAIVLRADLAQSWREGHPSATESVQPPAFVPVAVVLFIVFAALAGVLVAFFLDRHNWARLSLVALVVFMAVGALTGLQTDPPVVFAVLSWISVVIDAVLLAGLWHKDTGAYLRGVDVVGARSASSTPSA